MRHIFKAGLGLLALLALPSLASAQNAASCSIQASTVSVQTGTTYTLSPADGCKMIVFTSGSSVAVTMPNAATTLPNGFRVYIKSQGAGTVTLNTPTTSTIDGVAGPVSYTTGTGGEVRSDGVNYFTASLGIKHP